MSEDDCAFCAGFELILVVTTTALHFTPPDAYYAAILGLSTVFMDFFLTGVLGETSMRGLLTASNCKFVGPSNLGYGAIRSWGQAFDSAILNSLSESKTR
jgi:hypothetical protein